MARPVGRAAISQFSPWKNRIKTVLGETNDKIVEERDLGPAVLPGRASSSGRSISISAPCLHFHICGVDRSIAMIARNIVAVIRRLQIRVPARLRCVRSVFLARSKLDRAPRESVSMFQNVAGGSYRFALHRHW